MCRLENIQLYHLKAKTENDYTAYIELKDLKTIKRIRYKTKHKLHFFDRQGIFFLKQKLVKKYILLVTLCVSICFFIYLSQAIWVIDIHSDCEKLNHQIRQELKAYGVKEGVLSQWIKPPAEVQAHLLDTFPTILWVGIDQVGTTYRIEVIPKQIEQEQDTTDEYYLYAQKDGVIKRANVSKGRLLVNLNEFVKKGQLLVTGDLRPDDQEDSEDEEDVEKDLKKVEAEVYAETWYRSSVSIPLDVTNQLETGQTYRQYRLNINDFSLPLFGFKKEPFEHYTIEEAKRNWRIGPFDLPFSFTVNRFKERVEVEQNRTVEQAVEIGIEQATEDLLSQLDSRAKVLNEKILHQQVDDGKVKLHIYFTVEEDIVNTLNEHQGD